MSGDSAPFQLLELNVISAQDLARVARSMRTYAVSWVHPDRKLSTRVDAEGRNNPTWNDKFVFRVDEEFLYSDSSAIMIEIYALHWFKDIHVGTVRVLVGNLIPPPESRPFQGKGPLVGMRFLALQVRRPSGRPQGILNIGVTLLDSTMRSMPLYMHNPSAVGYRHLMGEKDAYEQHNHLMSPNRFTNNATSKPQLRRSKSDTSSVVATEAVALHQLSRLHKVNKASSAVSASEEVVEYSKKTKRRGRSRSRSSRSNSKGSHDSNDKINSAILSDSGFQWTAQNFEKEEGSILSGSEGSESPDYNETKESPYVYNDPNSIHGYEATMSDDESNEKQANHMMELVPVTHNFAYEVMKSPEPQFRNSPAPQFVKSPEPQFRNSPAPQFVRSPEPQFHNSPAPHYMKSPEPQFRNSPAPQFVKSQEPQFCNSPAPRFKKSKDPEFCNSPAPRYMKSPEPQFRNSPAPKYMKSQEPQFCNSPAPRYVKSQEPQFRNSPAPHYMKSPEPQFRNSPAPKFVKSQEPQYMKSPAPKFMKSQEPQYMKSPEPQYMKSPAPPYMKSPAPQYMKSPAPQYMKSPGPQFRNSSAPQFMKSPAPPQFRNSPAPQFRNSPKPQFHNSTAPQFHNSQAPQFHSSPGPQFRNSPKPQFKNSPSTQFRNSPAVSKFHPAAGFGGSHWGTPKATPLHPFGKLSGAFDQYGTPRRSNLGNMGPPTMTESELGPSPSEVAAAMARNPIIDEGDNSTVGGWSLDESVEGLQSKLERWQTELTPVYDRGELSSYPTTTTTNNKTSSQGYNRRHTDGGSGLFSCFSTICGAQCSITCGSDDPKGKKNRRRRTPSLDNSSFL